MMERMVDASALAILNEVRAQERIGPPLNSVNEAMIGSKLRLRARAGLMAAFAVLDQGEVAKIAADALNRMHPDRQYHAGSREVQQFAAQFIAVIKGSRKVW